MSAPQHCIGHISTPYGDAAILVGRYPSGGAIAIQLVDDEDPSAHGVTVGPCPSSAGAPGRAAGLRARGGGHAGLVGLVVLASRRQVRGDEE